MHNSSLPIEYTKDQLQQQRSKTTEKNLMSFSKSPKQFKPTLKYIVLGQNQYFELKQKVKEMPTFKLMKTQIKFDGKDGRIKFFVANGNNHELINSILTKRDYLSQTNSLSSYNFLWRPFSSRQDFETLQRNLRQGQSPQVYNHIEGHEYLTRKELMYVQISSYCRLKGIDYNTFLPQTFIININFSLQEQQRKLINQLSEGNKYFAFQIKYNPSYWIFKPPNLNRGNGIKIINDLKSLNKCIEEYKSLKILNTQQKSLSRFISTQKLQAQERILTYPAVQRNTIHQIHKKEIQSELNTSYYNSTSELGYVILQEYIKNPFLIRGRKFDFRIWVLIDHKRLYYKYKEGYLRLSSVEFDLNPDMIANSYIHLTNNAIQKYHSNYGQLESGNQMSMQQFSDYLYEKGFNGQRILLQLTNKMKEIIQYSFRSVRNKLNCSEKKYCFEIFGYDFMVDDNFVLWLIEINTNPCIELSSPLLQQLVPRMLNDAFRLTIDQIYQKDTSYLCNNYKIDDQKTLSKFTNEVNLWELIGSACKNI